MFSSKRYTRGSNWSILLYSLGPKLESKFIQSWDRQDSITIIFTSTSKIAKLHESYEHKHEKIASPEM